jgi:hypothetical protein
MIEYEAVDRWCYNTTFGIQISDDDDDTIFHMPLDGNCWKLKLSEIVWNNDQ